MASCKCGGKTIKVKKVAAKRVTPKKVSPKKSSSGSSARSKRLSAIATKKATKLANSRKNPYAKGCNCN